MTVSSLNIAQANQKYGIIERENYNKAKCHSMDHTPPPGIHFILITLFPFPKSIPAQP